jgi:hypothetical protein
MQWSVIWLAPFLSSRVRVSCSLSHKPPGGQAKAEGVNRVGMVERRGSDDTTSRAGQDRNIGWAVAVQKTCSTRSGPDQIQPVWW